MIEVIKKVIRAYEHGRFMKCGLDTLVRIDENVLSCRYCVFRDTNKFVNFLGCPMNWICTFGTYKSMVK